MLKSVICLFKPKSSCQSQPRLSTASEIKKTAVILQDERRSFCSKTKILIVIMTQKGVGCKSFSSAFGSFSVLNALCFHLQEEFSALAKLYQEIFFDTKLSNGDER